MNQVYLYKVTVDDGVAPCPQDGLLTLAICKPAIRRTAMKGAYLIGVGSINRYQGKLIYVAQIEEPIPGAEYYRRGSAYRDRWDCIYTLTAGKYEWRNHGGRRVHDPAKTGGQMKRDVGFCGRQSNAVVLPSRRFAYFGKDTANHSEKIWEKFTDIWAFAHPFGQSHLVHHRSDRQNRLEEFCEWVLTQPWPGFPMMDKPHNVPNSSHCHDCGGKRVVCGEC